MVWIFIGLAGIAVFAVSVVLVIVSAGKNKGDGKSGRPGYQDVIVSDAVDVATQQLVSGTGAYFPNMNGIQSTPTLFTDGNTEGWYLVLIDNNTGKKYRKVFRDSLTVGRDPAVKSGEARLIIDDNLVSKNHCAIRSDSNNLTIRDLGSKNGTYLNGYRIEGRAYIRNRDRLEIGNSSFIIQVFRQ